MQGKAVSEGLMSATQMGTLMIELIHAFLETQLQLKIKSSPTTLRMESYRIT